MDYDIYIQHCNDSRKQVKESLGRWRYALEKREMKVSGSKAQARFEREADITLKMQRYSRGSEGG